ncbi:MAG TPA: tRNA pseudouridine(55) synthase TruB [Candidatus Xenobia bacterium]|nr:tRNA pseudouridine(55) synthase TruB [Candidatus Xenobia bacterium]
MTADTYAPARGMRRRVDGVLPLDKPAGISSHSAVQRVKRLYRALKAGHTGTLDPAATGLLPVCLGEATKFSHLLLDADKTYLASIRLGMVTSTGDLEGEVTARRAVRVEEEQVRAALKEFVGELLQTPPMHSAIKRGGMPLYKLARAGREVPRPPRKVRILALELVSFEGEELTVLVTCSKGTYVRVLAEDIGRTLGCGACLSALRRTAVGGFDLAAAVGLERLEAASESERDALLMPVDALVASLPRCDLDETGARRLRHGQPVEWGGAAWRGLARVYGPGREFLGVAEMLAPGRIVPRRLCSTATMPAPPGGRTIA